MKFTSATKLKDWISKKAIKNDVEPALMMRYYMMERFLERISVSKYRENLILKGGFLISSLVGLDLRMTMDMDTTIRGLEINREIIEDIVNELISIDIDDGITFEVLKIKSIRPASEHDDFQFSLRCWFYKMRADIRVDFTVGDLILPNEIEHDYQLMFEERTISVMAYNLYTILAEKLDAILTLNVDSTRLRDYYDIHLLVKLHQKNINRQAFCSVFLTKMENRGHIDYAKSYAEYIAKISDSEMMKMRWKNYQAEYSYAKEIEFEDIIPIINWLLESFVNCGGGSWD